MEEIEWTNGVTKLNKTTMDRFQNNIKEAIDDVQNNVDILENIAEEKQDQLTAGENITIENNIISSTGGGSNNIYSTEETQIGTWLGKPLYRKVIQLQSSQFGSGTATTGGSYTIPHGVNNIEFITHNSNALWIRNVSPLQYRYFPLVLFNNVDWNGQVYFTNANCIFELGTTLLNQIRTNTNAMYAILEYTKTTDT